MAVHERLCEENRGHRRRPGPDHHRGEDVSPTQPNDCRQRPCEERQREQHQHDVLTEDDRRDGGGLRQRRADPRIEPPEGGGDRDEQRRDRTSADELPHRRSVTARRS